MTYEERMQTNPLLRAFSQKLTQIIVQSRMGLKIGTKSKSPAKGSFKKFNIEMDDLTEIIHENKRFCGTQIVSPGQPYCIEFAVKTNNFEDMVLEVWTLTMDELPETISADMSSLPFDNMCRFLKSILCVSRITPAYNLSFGQSPEQYVICYSMYLGEPQYDCLGENTVTWLVAQGNIPMAHLELRLSFRTNLIIPSAPKIPNDQMMLKSDHFKLDSSPKHYRRVNERTFDSDNPHKSNESQDGVKPFPTSPVEYRSASPRSCTSSESSQKSSLSQLPTEKIYVPFATTKLILSDDYLADLPLSNLIAASSAEKAEESKQEIKELKERRISESKLPRFTRTDKMNTSTHSNKSAASNVTKEDADYVVVDLKTPFVDGENMDAELTNFYKGVQGAPELASFSDGYQDLVNVNDELKKFEICADDYDDLVKSFNTDSECSSLELG